MKSDHFRWADKALPHVVWDWNGTLLHDFVAVLQAVNSCLAKRGMNPITRKEYHDSYVRPPRTFHEGLTGRAFTDDEWLAEQASFDRSYAAHRHDSALAPDALKSLEFLRRCGVRQSLLSMLRHDLLLDMVREHELTQFFSLIEGSHGQVSGSKYESLRCHLSRLGVSPSRVTLIGDSTDDARSAMRIGASCILVAANSCQSRLALERSSCITCETLWDAVHSLMKVKAWKKLADEKGSYPGAQIMLPARRYLIATAGNRKVAWILRTLQNPLS